MTDSNQTNPPVFILGMLQRTGTNYLWDLFGLHPDVELLRPVFEDHLIRWSSHLFAYVEDVERSWDATWEVPDHEATDLTHRLGDGIAHWVADRSDKRVVTKMPTVEHAHRFFDLLPNCPLVVIIRDGRNVAESMTTTFDMPYERSFRRWQQAADVVLKMQREHADRDNFAVIRYEDIADRPADVMRQLCEVTGLDPERYPYDQIIALPVRGSSTLRSVEGEEMHWDGVARPDTFDPHSRWESWSPHEHRRFDKVAGVQQRALGYDLVEVDGSDTVGERLNDAKDHTETLYRELRVKGGRALRSLRRVNGRI